MRTFKGFENYSDERALNVINSIDKLARILLPIVIETLDFMSNPDKFSSFAKGKQKIEAIVEKMQSFIHVSPVKNKPKTLALAYSLKDVNFTLPRIAFYLKVFLEEPMKVLKRMSEMNSSEW